MNSTNEILFVSSYPPRECGIATYTQDLINAIKEKFGNSFSLTVCALENKEVENIYPEEVKYVLQTSDSSQYANMAEKINLNKNIKLVFIQHEFGLFSGEYGNSLLSFLEAINKPITIAFHTVLPNTDDKRGQIVKALANLADTIVVMTNNSKELLKNDYYISPEKISVIYHGTHLVTTGDKNEIKAKYNLEGKNILSTFGLLSSGKCIETAIDALPAIIEQFPETIYCIAGITHPSVVKREGEKYREFLEDKIAILGIEENVRFINKYLSLEELLEILQITDIYLFTSKDPYQAVSGTLSYAMGCSCVVISTPIPHAKEMLANDTGIIVDFHNPTQLSQSAINLLSDPKLRHQISLNALHKIKSTSWQNSAVAHAELIMKNMNQNFLLDYTLSDISLSHIKRLSTKFGIIQFANIIHPDIQSGYTLDDNARALIAVSKHYELFSDVTVLPLIDIFLSFIEFVQQKDGNFLNYVDEEGIYPIKNQEVNLEDSEGRAIWALGEFIANVKPHQIQNALRAEIMMNKALVTVAKFKSPRAISFVIKGLYYYNLIKKSPDINRIIVNLADNLVSKFQEVSDEKWEWYEDYLTYANSILPEALLYAYLSSGNELYKIFAKSSFDFLLSIIFVDNKIKVISNNGWHKRGEQVVEYGEQPIDVSYTILTLDLFYKVFKQDNYLQKLKIAFSWFNGNNHLNRIIYDPVTGGCQDGLEEHNVNLNQGAESTICYLLARLVMEKHIRLKVREDDLTHESISRYKKKNASHMVLKKQISGYQNPLGN